jgi:hypothetical protein
MAQNRAPNALAFKKSLAVLVGSLVALVLLAIYALTTLHMIRVVECMGQDQNCATYSEDSITPQTITVQNTIYGLVSALVIAVLATTQPGELPSGTKSAGVSANKDSEKLSTAVAILFLLVWVFCGVYALYVGTLSYPTINETLRDIGTTWLGLAITAGFAYFGLKPAATPGEGSSDSQESLS